MTLKSPLGKWIETKSLHGVQHIYEILHRFDQESAEEMKFHLEMKVEENLRAGMSPQEARYAAQRQCGNQALLREVGREVWLLRYLETLWRDIRYGWRIMHRHRGFTLLTILVLALGIGDGTVIFSIVDAVLLRLLPSKTRVA